jgi:hypothetical protein
VLPECLVNKRYFNSASKDLKIKEDFDMAGQLAGVAGVCYQNGRLLPKKRKATRSYL